MNNKVWKAERIGSAGLEGTLNKLAQGGYEIFSVAPVPESTDTFLIVASKYNSRYVDEMLRAAKEVLKNSRAKRIQVVRVPGAYEIPVVAARAARTEPGWSAIICLGVILRGETTHAQHIGEAVSHALSASVIPVVRSTLEEHASIDSMS